MENYKDSDKRNQTYSRWASSDEIKESLYEFSFNGIKPEYGGIPLYKENGNVYIEKNDVHTLILGSTGTKKTRLLGMPSLLIYAMAGESFIATDPKAELYEKTYSVLKKEGYNIFVLNLRDPVYSNCWNPLLIPYRLYHNNKRDKAIELVNDLAKSITKNSCLNKDPYWENSACDILAGLILILFECAEENEINFKSLRTLKTQAFKSVDHVNKEDIPFIREKFLKHINQSSFVCSLLSGTSNVCDVTRGCIVSTFDQAVRPFFCQDDLIDTLSDHHLEMEKIGKEKTAVFLIIPDENSLYHLLVSVLIKQIYTVLILEAQKQPKKTLPLRVNYLLDEFASLPTINDFPAMITASRSRNIRFNLLIQSFSQLYQRYGSEAETIKGNCENWVFLHSRDKSTLEEFCLLSGTKNNEEPLVSMSLLQRLDKEKGEALIFHKRQFPFLTHLLDIDSYPKMLLDDIKIEYPHNNRKVQNVFDFEKFCNNNTDYFLSQLFSGKTHKEILKDQEGFENYLISKHEDVILEPLFKSKLPKEKKKKDKQNIDIHKNPYWLRVNKKVRVYAISDLHLSGKNITKPMNIFESYSSGYIEDVKDNWNMTVQDDDVVLISGDISWASNFDDAKDDLDFIGQLKGIKVIIRGNHDYWWQSISKVRSVLCNETYAIQNDSIKIGNTVICGTRGWTLPDFSKETKEEDIKIYLREIERLKLSLEDASVKRNEGDVLICMTHFPPINSAPEDNDFTGLLNDYKVNKLVYGHLHGSDIQTPLCYENNGIEYYLTSCDLTHNKLIQIL